MARMIPAYFDESGPNPSAAERKLFQRFKTEPGTGSWTVLHSLGLSRRDKKPYGEIDFVVLIPGRGIVCLEVKGGNVVCKDGVWETTGWNKKTSLLGKSPFMQAREGMFALRKAVLDKAPPGFPSDAVFGYAAVFPDVPITDTSPEWERWQVLDRDALQQPLSKLLEKVAHETRALLNIRATSAEPSAATLEKVRLILRPDFEQIITKAARIEETDAQLIRLTEEQYAGLDLFEDHERCLFDGAAGTGKTMLALEYARRYVLAGKRTLFVCFNKLLGQWLKRRVDEMGLGMQIVVGSYHALLRERITRTCSAEDFAKSEREASTPQQRREFFWDLHGYYGRLALEELGEQFEAIVVDEAQDFLNEPTLDVFDAWLAGGWKAGRWALFGDFQRQAIYASEGAAVAKQKLLTLSGDAARPTLKINCRNTRFIGEETAMLSGFDSPPFRLGTIDGLPVDRREYSSAAEQSAALGQVVQALLKEGVRPEDIVVLSRLRRENSGISDCRGHGFRLIDVDEPLVRSREHLIRFSTIQAFKGMESPVIILCDVAELAGDEPQSLLYVGMSRARTQLVLLMHTSAIPAYRECVKRQLRQHSKTPSP